MQIRSLDHVNLRTARLGEMIAWYGDILGLNPGPRPDFSFGGAWLYIGDLAAIHLVEVSETPEAGQDVRLEHFALGASGLPEFLEGLKAASVPYDLRRVPGFPIVQVNLHDPDGNHIHVDFDVAELPDGA